MKQKPVNFNKFIENIENSMNLEGNSNNWSNYINTKDFTNIITKVQSRFDDLNNNLKPTYYHKMSSFLLERINAFESYLREKETNQDPDVNFYRMYYKEKIQRLYLLDHKIAKYLNLTPLITNIHSMPKLVHNIQVSGTGSCSLARELYFNYLNVCKSNTTYPITNNMLTKLKEYVAEYIGYRRQYMNMSLTPIKRQEALVKATILISMVSATPDNLENISQDTWGIYSGEEHNRIVTYVNSRDSMKNNTHGDMMTNDANWSKLVRYMVNNGSRVIKQVYNRRKAPYTGDQRPILPMLHSISSGVARGSCIDKAIWNLYTIIGQQNRTSDPKNREVLKLWPSHFEISKVRNINHTDYGHMNVPILDVNSEEIFTILTTASIHRQIKGTTQKLKHRNDLLCMFYNMIIDGMNKKKMRNRVVRNFSSASNKGLYQTKQVRTRSKSN